MFRSLLQSALICVALAATGCSPGIFGSATDSSLEKIPTYQKINPDCGGVDLGRSRFTVTSFRALVNCLNGQGAMPEIAAFFNHTGEEDLAPLIELINDRVVADPKFLFGVERTYEDLDKRGRLSPALQNLAALLGHDDLVASALVLWRTRSWSERLGLGPSRADLLKSMEVLGARLDADAATRLLDSAQWMVGGKSLPELAGHLALPGRVGIADGSEKLASYLRGAQSGDRADILRRAIESVWSGDFLRALDPTVGGDPARVRAQVPKLAALFDSLFGNGGELARELGGVVHDLSLPIPCLKGARSVSRPTALILNDLAEIDSPDPQAVADRANEYLMRTDPLRLVSLGPLCTYPDGLGEHIHKSHDILVKSPALVPLVEALRGLHGIQSGGRYPLVDLTVDLFADPGLDDLLAPLAGLSERGAWADLLLIANRAPLESRSAHARPGSYDYLTQKRSELGGKSVSEVLASSLAWLDAAKISGIATASLGLLQASETDLRPAVDSLRDVLQANDLRPFIGLARELLEHATAHQDLYDSLYRLGADSRELRSALHSLPRLARNGQLRDLVGSLVTIFHQQAARGASPAHSGQLGAAKPGRHDLAEYELTAFQAPVPRRRDELLDRCGRFDFAFGIDQYASPKFREQMDLFVACLRADGKGTLGEETAVAMQYLLDEKTESGASVFGFGVDMIRDWAGRLDASQLAWFLDSWTRQYDDGRFQQALSACHAWIDEDHGGGPVLRPLIDALAQSYDKARAPLERVEKTAGRLLKRAEIPRALGYLDDLTGLKFGPVPSVTGAKPDAASDGERTSKWVANKECESGLDSKEAVGKRAEQLIDDYRSSVTTWDLVDGQPRKQWTIPTLRGLLEPMLTQLARPSYIQGQTRVIDSLVHAMSYFTLEPGKPVDRDHHFSREYLESWLRARSNDYRRITYFYPGETRPRVKIVNSLDRLELLVINADISGPSFPVDENNALKYLGQIAEAWGDEDPAVWPPEIQQKFNETGEAPKTLAQVVEGMKSDQDSFMAILGLPPRPRCVVRDTGDAEDIEIPNHGPVVPIPIPGFDPKPLQISLYNLQQVLPVLSESLPGSGTALDGGLKVLRDLFFQLYYSTNPDDRTARKGELNNLSIVSKMCRLGVIRQLGRVLRETPAGDPATSSFYQSFLDIVQSPDILGVARPLVLDDPSHGLIWKFIEKVFAQLDQGPEARERVKQIGFYSVANAREMGIVDGLVRNLGAAVHEHADFLIAHADVLDDLLSSDNVRAVMRGYAQGNAPATAALKLQLKAITDDALSDPRLVADILAGVRPLVESAPWDSFKSRKDALEASPAYQALHFTRIRRDLLDVIEERSTDPREVLFGRNTRQALAAQLDAAQLDHLLWVAAHNPDGFYHLLRTFAQGAGTQTQPGDLMEFFGFIRRGLAL